MAEWQVKKNGRAVVSSPVKNCGYDEATLQSLKQAGYSLYLDGKCVMKGRSSNDSSRYK